MKHIERAGIVFGVFLISVLIIVIHNNEVNELEKEIEGLENLVEYHMQQNYILIHENWTLKSQLEKQINQ